MIEGESRNLRRARLEGYKCGTRASSRTATALSKYSQPRMRSAFERGFAEAMQLRRSNGEFEERLCPHCGGEL